MFGQSVLFVIHLLLALGMAQQLYSNQSQTRNHGFKPMRPPSCPDSRRETITRCSQASCRGLGGGLLFASLSGTAAEEEILAEPSCTNAAEMPDYDTLMARGCTCVKTCGCRPAYVRRLARAEQPNGEQNSECVRREECGNNN